MRVIDKMVQNAYVDRDIASVKHCIFETELELFDKGLIASGERELTFSYEANSGLMSLRKQAM